MADGAAPSGQAERPAPAQAPPGAQQTPDVDLDVAVIGGGPGGLAAAKAILTARPDLRVAVFERSTLRPRGAGLLVHPNGIAALEAIDPSMAQAVLALDWPQGDCRYLTKEGEQRLLLTGADSPVLYIRQRGGPLSTCPWHSLQAALAGCLPPGVLRQQVAFERLEESADGSHITLHFQGGQAPLTARLVVGADGCQSAVRQQIIGDGPPLFLGLALWRAIVPPPSWWPTNDPGLCHVYGMPPLTVGIGSMAHRQLYWSAAAPWPEERLGEIGGSGAAYIQDPLERQEQGEERKRRVLALFADWCAEVRSLIEGTDPLTITQHAQWYRLPEACKVWGKGRVTLLGDAAHLATPGLGQGTSQAFEDALELGRAIGERGAAPEALRAYEGVEPVHRRSVEMYLQFRAGGPTLQHHIENEKIGTWPRSFLPLPRPGASAAV